MEDLYNTLAGVNDRTQPMTEEERERCVEIMRMSQTKGWKYLLEYMDELRKESCETPMFYSNNPTAAHIHAGAVDAIDLIKQTVINSNLQMEKYAKDKQNGSVGSID